MATLVENATAISNGYNNFRNNVAGNTIQELVLPKNITTIRDYAFYKDINLKNVILPNGLITIGNYSFCYCNLQSLIIPNTVTSIGYSAFSYGADLETSNVELKIPSSVQLIENMAFYRWENLGKIILEHGVKQIRNDVFGQCTHVIELSIPNTLTEILNRVFDGCQNLEFVTIENGFNCNNLNLSSSTLYSVETIVSWLEALADRTGETAYTLTIGTTNINKLTAEQIAIATNKNWNLA